MFAAACPYCSARLVNHILLSADNLPSTVSPRVNTANSDDAVEGGDNWEWDGEDEDGQDIEMAPTSTSSAGVAAASRSSASAPPTEPLTFQASRALSGSGESTALASGGALGQKHGLMLGESGGPPAAGESAEDGRRRGGGRGRGGRGGSGRGPKPSSSRGKREESASNILPDDDLFAVRFHHPCIRVIAGAVVTAAAAAAAARPYQGECLTFP